MNIYGVEVDENHIYQAIGETLLAGVTFTANDMEQRLKNCGVDDLSAYRCADRVLQRLRRSGAIVWDASSKSWLII